MKNNQQSLKIQNSFKNFVKKKKSFDYKRELLSSSEEIAIHN